MKSSTYDVIGALTNEIQNDAHLKQNKYNLMFMT